MNALKKYKVSVFGENYSLITDEDEKNFLNCIEHVDSLMRAIAQKGNHGDIKRVAILTALQITLRLKNIECDLALSESRIQKLIHTIEQELLIF